MATLATAFYVVVCSMVTSYARQHDFLSFYTGSTLVREGRLPELYDFNVQSARERELVPGLAYVAPYIRPPFYAFLLAPLSLLSLNAAFVLWLAAQITGLLLCWIWAWRRFGPDSLIFCSLFLPAAYGIAHGQDCVFVMLLVLGAFLSMERGRDFMAGALLALTLIKFHLLLVLPIALLLRKRWRMLGGYVAIAAIEVLASILLVGLEGVRQYATLLTRRDLETLSPSPEMMINLRALATNLGVNGMWIEGLLIAAALGIAGFAALRAKEDWRWFWAAVVASLLIAPHAYEYDAAMLLPPALMAVSTSLGRFQRIAAGIVLMPVPYLLTLFHRPFAAAPALVLATFLIALAWTRAGTREQPA